MANLSLSIAPGYYLEPQTASWNLSADVDFVSFSQDGTQPAISKYIAYDTLVPPSPFLAVTQDGTGNVVYDGGFPKFYNANAPALGTPFSGLQGGFKYLYNALNFCANPAKVAAGNKKVLIMGDAPVTASYPIKGTGPSGFFTAMTNLCAVAGYTPTFRDVSDYAGGKLNPTLAELDQYCCVVFFSTAYATANPDLITEAAITEFSTYRRNGNGLVFITDHGSTEITSVSQVRLTPDGDGFYGTANRIMANFGTFFSGNFNRTPVNVGFLRTTYGDHPLYAGMADSDSIAAGGSESKVVLATFPKYTAANIPKVSINTNGVNTVKALVMLKSGVVETYSFVYVIATGQLIKFLDRNGAEINSLPRSFDTNVDFSIELVTPGLGTIVGEVRLNNRLVADLSFTDIQGSREAWYMGGASRLSVNKGDVFTARITSPFTFERTLTVNRYQPSMTGKKHVYEVVKALQADGFASSTPRVAIHDAIKRMTLVAGHLGYIARGDYARDIQQLRNFYGAATPLPEQPTFVYANSSAAFEAMMRIVPPTPKQVFDTWDRFANDAFFPKGVGATGEAAGWVWNVSLNAAVMPLNTGAFVGFVSPDSVDDYELDVVIKSDNNDDDQNGIVLAFNRVGAINNRLFLSISRGGLTPTPRVSHAICVNDLATTIQTSNFAGMNAGPNNGEGWNGRYTRVRVRRNGDVFKVENSPWNSMTFDPAGTFEFNVNDDPRLLQFKGPKPWGFINCSQPASYFTIRTFKGGVLWDLIVDAENNVVYRYLPGGWTAMDGMKAQDVFGAPRTLKNPETGQSFRLNVNGTITSL